MDEICMYVYMHVWYIYEAQNVKKIKIMQRKIEEAGREY